ncbi:hypothetical protein D3C73_1077200 [compost metagenome]
MLHHFTERKPLELSCLRIVILLISGQRSFLPSGNSKQSVGHNAVIIGQVSKQLLDAPFPFCIAVIALLLAQPVQQIIHQTGLLLKHCRKLPFRGDQRNVTGRKFTVLSWLWTLVHKTAPLNYFFKKMPNSVKCCCCILVHYV